MKLAANGILAQLDKARSNITVLEEAKTNICSFGPTGAGKSSLICYQLQYQKMKFRKEGFDFSLTHEESANMPTIGNSKASETELPVSYRKGNLNFIDLPGIFQTKGVEQEIVNSYSTSQIFKKGRSFKFIIVLEVASLLSGKGQMLANVIMRLEELLGKDFESIAESCCLVISKFDSTRTEEDIYGLITSIINYNSVFRDNHFRKKLVQTILNNKKLMFFPIPTDFSPERLKIIEEGIEKLSSYSLTQNSQVSLSEEAKKLMSNEIERVRSSIKEEVKKVAFKIKEKYSINYQDINSAEIELGKLRKALQFQGQFKERIPLKEMTKVLFSVQYLEVDKILVLFEQLRQLERIFQKNQGPYFNLFASLFDAINLSKQYVQNKIYTIQAQIEKQRRERQLQLERQRQQRIYAEQARIAEENRRRAEEERVRREREEAARRQAELERQRKQQEEAARKKQEQIQWLQNHPPPPNYDDDSDDDCRIF